MHSSLVTSQITGKSQTSKEVKMVDWEEVYDAIQSERIERENVWVQLDYLWVVEIDNMGF